MGSGGGGSSNTTQVQQIPQFEQDFATANQNIAASLASNPYPTYQGQLIAGMTDQQTQGMQMAGQAATSYQPDLSAAENLTGASTQQWSPQAAQQYMSPYAQAALAPQIEAQQQGLATQQLATNANATQAGAFGDARNGVANSLNNFYGDQSLANIEATGMNSAYNAGLGAFQTANQQLQTAGNQFGTLAGQQQGLGETGANSLYGAGAQQQQLNQQQLTESYNNFLNQANWGQNELGLRESALSNTPYANTNYLSLAPANGGVQALGAFSSLASLLGGGSGGSSSANGNYFGGSTSSDSRLKRDIKRIGRTLKGIPLYAYKYIWDDIERIGVMAEEAFRIIPESVTRDNAGYLMVDYGRIQ